MLRAVTFIAAVLCYDVFLDRAIHREPLVAIPTAGLIGAACLLLFYPHKFELHRKKGLRYLTSLALIDLLEDWTREWPKMGMGILLCNSLRNAQPLLSIAMATVLGEYRAARSTQVKHLLAGVLLMCISSLVLWAECTKPVLRPEVSVWHFSCAATCLAVFMVMKDVKARLIYQTEGCMEEITFWTSLSQYPFAEMQLHALGRPSLTIHQLVGSAAVTVFFATLASAMLTQTPKVVRATALLVCAGLALLHQRNDLSSLDVLPSVIAFTAVISPFVHNFRAYGFTPASFQLSVTAAKIGASIALAVIAAKPLQWWNAFALAGLFGAGLLLQ